MDRPTPAPGARQLRSARAARALVPELDVPDVDVLGADRSVLDVVPELMLPVEPELVVPAPVVVLLVPLVPVPAAPLVPVASVLDVPAAVLEGAGVSELVEGAVVPVPAAPVVPVPVLCACDAPMTATNEAAAAAMVKLLANFMRISCSRVKDRFRLVAC